MYRSMALIHRWQCHRVRVLCRCHMPVRPGQCRYVPFSEPITAAVDQARGAMRLSYYAGQDVFIAAKAQPVTARRSRTQPDSHASTPISLLSVSSRSRSRSCRSTTRSPASTRRPVVSRRPHFLAVLSSARFTAHHAAFGRAVDKTGAPAECTAAGAVVDSQWQHVFPNDMSLFEIALDATRCATVKI